MGVSMSKFSAMTRSELHLFSLKLQVGALTNSPTMGGESATTEQSAPVKPDTDRLLLLGRIASVATCGLSTIVTDGVAWSSVCLSACHDREPAKTAEPIGTQFGILSWMDPAKNVLDRGADVSRYGHFWDVWRIEEHCKVIFLGWVNGRAVQKRVDQS